MKRKRLLIAFLVFLLLAYTPSVHAIQETASIPLESLSPISVSSEGPQINAQSAVLMDVRSKTVLFAQNAEEALPPASVTKVMTLLLIAEEIDSGRLSLKDSVCVSEHAASMGGSQVYLEAGEVMSVEDLLKSVVMASANDAACALAEHICGSEETFVKKMNERAIMLGMTGTNFENTNGLDDTTLNHVTSAKDIAIMSAELLAHEWIKEYTTLWTDTIRNGAFTLTNTNRLVRFYPGCTGLKTGSTAKAKFCISASAQKGDLELVAVIMGAQTRDVRNEEAKKLLDWGFSNFALYSDEGIALPDATVIGGVKGSARLGYTPWVAVTDKSYTNSIKITYEITDTLQAPIKEGETVGKVIYRFNDQVLHEEPITLVDGVEKISFSNLYFELWNTFLGG